MAFQTTVLVATNDGDLLNALGFTLNQHGYHVVTAQSGDGAVALIDLQLPDIAVLDMLLPGQSGFQLTRLLKERTDGQVPVVMISDQTAPAHRDYAFAAGVDRFLEKWLAPTRLVELVESICPLRVERRRPGSGTLPHPAATPA
jgi:two-component system, OmpR family, response regulator